MIVITRWLRLGGAPFETVVRSEVARQRMRRRDREVLLTRGCEPLREERGVLRLLPHPGHFSLSSGFIKLLLRR